MKVSQDVALSEKNVRRSKSRNLAHKSTVGQTQYKILYFSDRASSYNSGSTVSSMICLFEFSTCFEQLCAYPQEDNCINKTSGIITLKTNEWYTVTKITRIYRSCIVHKPLKINYIFNVHGSVHRNNILVYNSN